MVILITFLLLTFASLGSAAPASRDRVTSAPAVVSNEQVHDWLHLWQKRLHLEEWKVEVKIVRIWDLEQGTLGHIDWSVPHKTAVIKVLNPADYELPRDRVPADMELSIVHELVHLLCPEGGHGRLFTAFMLAYLPDWEERQQQLYTFR